MNARELAPREKKLLAAGLLLMVVFAIIMYSTFFGSGAQRQGADLKRMEHVRQTFLSELDQYRSIRGLVEEVDKNLEKTPGGYELFDTISSIIDTLGIRSAVTNMTPNKTSGTEYYSEVYVDVDIKQITLDDLVALLEQIEKQPAFLRVSQLSVKRRFSDDRTLDVNIRVMAYGNKEEGEP